MSKGLRASLRILSSLAVLWTLIALISVFTMGFCGGMMGHSDIMRGMHGGGMMGEGWLAGMMLLMTLTWLVMLGLVGVFVYLIVTARRTT